MSDPSGWKQFTDGDVLPADQIRGYLQQGVLVFDNSSQRDSTLVGVVREGMVAYAKDTDAVSYYNGTSWNVITGQIAFASVAARDAAIPNPSEGRYAYITGTQTLYVYTSGAWVRTGPNVESTKNILSFTGSGSTTVPAWATRMYYAIVGGGGNPIDNSSPPSNSIWTGGSGGQVVQGSTTSISPGQTVTVSVGGAASNSSVALSGGSTFTATGGGGAAGGAGNPLAAGSNGTFLSTPFNFGWIAGGGGGYFSNVANNGLGHHGGVGGGGSGANLNSAQTPNVISGIGGDPNSGGGGSGPFNYAGGSGVVYLLFT